MERNVSKVVLVFLADLLTQCFHD